MNTTTFYKIVPVKPVEHGSCIPGSSLGNGGFGDVVACKDGKYVMKMTRTTRAFGETEDKEEEMVGEYEYIDYCVPDRVDKYLYVAKMYPVMKEGSTTCYDRTKLVMDRMTGDLYSLYNDFIQGDSNTSWRNIEFINNNLAPKLDKMLKYLHDTVGYCHNDIKPANIGYYTNQEDEELSVKLLDMGSSVKIEKNEKPYKMGPDSRLHGGTVVYMTKNTFEEIQDSKDRDRWAMGCTLYELIAGVPMNSGLNSHDFSYFNILSNYNEALLKYMLGFSKTDKGILWISNTMREARTKFLAAFNNGFQKYREGLVKRIHNYMTQSLTPKQVGSGGGSSRFRRGVQRIGGGEVCRDPTPKDDGVITGKGKDDRLEIIRVTDMSKYRAYIKTMKNCTIDSVQSAGNNNNKPTRKKITEKQYERSKNAGKKRVARYRLKDGSYVHYMYQ